MSITDFIHHNFPIKLFPRRIYVIFDVLPDAQYNRLQISPKFYTMLRKIISWCFLLFAPRSLFAEQRPAVVAVIFDSDMGPDYDDVGAITLLHAFADSGYAKILATVASTKYEGVAAVFDVFNTYFKRPNLLIGVPKGKALELKDWQHWTDTVLKNYPHSIKLNDEVPDAISVYRKVLASQPDKSVTIITVGFVTNLAGLLQSPPDQYSKLARNTTGEKESPATGLHGRTISRRG